MTCLAFLGFRQCFFAIKIKRESLRQLKNERQYWEKTYFLKNKISFFYQNKIFCFCDFKIDSNQREVAAYWSITFQNYFFQILETSSPRGRRRYLVVNQKQNEMKWNTEYTPKTSQGNFSFSTVNKLNKNKTVAFNDNFNPPPWFF